MAIIKCPECSKEISSAAIACPHCGYPIANNKQLKQEKPKSNVVYCYKEGFQHFFLRCSCGNEFRYLNTMYKRKVLENGDYCFAGGAPIFCPQCNALYDTITLRQEEKIEPKSIHSDSHIISCPVCGKNVSSNANSCPNCGEPIKIANKCPICGSTDLEKLTVVNRSVSAFMWGFGSNKIGKTYQCKNCKSTF